VYGNYCGPGWYGGAYQPAGSPGALPPIDAVDAQCKLHDTVYATSHSPLDLNKSDMELGDIAEANGHHWMAFAMHNQPLLRMLGLLPSGVEEKNVTSSEAKEEL